MHPDHADPGVLVRREVPMSAETDDTHERQRVHDLRGALNGVALQLEVLALAMARGNEALHARALIAARGAVEEAVRILERPRTGPTDAGDAS